MPEAGQEHWRRIQEAFEAAAACPPEEREVLLARLRDANPVVHSAVLRMLEDTETASTRLEGVIAGGETSFDAGKFQGNDRYRVLQRLGAGGFGVVYEVLDTARQEQVALKMMLRTGPRHASLLKREFRSLAGLFHRNLAELYELTVGPEATYFTMELVDGCRFTEYVRQLPFSDDARWRDVVSQLAAGVHALHTARKLHLDLKPSNILITPEGRVVILDFGLVTDVVRGQAVNPRGGTPAYAAPEQFLGRAVSPASDWYSVGIVLYEALTGRRPVSSQVKVPPGPPLIASLCAELLEQEPARRPTGQAVLDRLGIQGAPALLVPIFGREQELVALTRCLEAARAGRPALAFIEGPAGVGKTALVEQFLEMQVSDPSILILSSVCSERESIPFQAVDGLIEELRGEVPAGFMDLGQPLPGPGDARERRKKSFELFRETLKTVSRDRLPLLHIDDAHWADSDSAALLEFCLGNPNPPAMAMLVSYRPAAAAGVSPLVQALARTHAGAHALRIQLAPLEALDAIAANEREIAQRLEGLDPAAFRLLTIGAVAGHPLEQSMVMRAADVHDENALSSLRGHGFVRLYRVSARTEIAVEQDSVREAVIRSLSREEIISIHLRIARLLEAAGARPQLLALHCFAAGLRPEARRYALEAASFAEERLAFDSAAAFYRLALNIGSDPGVRRQFALTLSAAGRDVEAAHAYLECAADLPGANRLPMLRSAANLFLTSGHIEQGLAVLQRVLEPTGLRLPDSAIRAIAALLFSRVRIAVMGLYTRGRPLSEQELDLAETYWTVAQGLGVVDTIYAAVFHSRHLELALRGDDKVRLARALALDSAFQAFGGRHRARVAANTLRRASLLAIETNDTYAQGLCELASSVVAFLAMDWERARAQLEVAETVLAEHPAGMAWELATAHLMWCVSMFFLGRLKELAHSLPALLRVAELRGDRYESTDLRLRIAHVLHLMEDEPDRAAATVEEAIASWPKTRFYLQHWWGLIAATEIALYRGDAAGAWKLFLESRVPLRRSLLMRIQYIRIETLHHRGCAAIAVAAKTGGRPAQPLLRQALDDAARLRRAKAPMATALALMLEAGVAAGREPSRAALLLAQAEAEFTALNMSLYQAVAKRCRGEILAGSGTELVAAADRWMESQGIRNPVRMSDALAPRLVVLQP